MRTQCGYTRSPSLRVQHSLKVFAGTTRFRCNQALAMSAFYPKKTFHLSMKARLGVPFAVEHDWGATPSLLVSQRWRIVPVVHQDIKGLEGLYVVEPAPRDEDGVARQEFALLCTVERRSELRVTNQVWLG